MEHADSTMALDFRDEHEVEVSFGPSDEKLRFANVCEYVRAGDTVTITVDEDSGKTMEVTVESGGLRTADGVLMKKE